MYVTFSVVLFVALVGLGCQSRARPTDCFSRSPRNTELQLQTDPKKGVIMAAASQVAQLPRRIIKASTRPASVTAPLYMHSPLPLLLGLHRKHSGY